MKNYKKKQKNKNLAGLNTSTLKYAVTWEGMAEFLQAEIDKVLNANSDLKKSSAQLQEKQNQLTGIREIQALKTEELNKQIKPLQQQSKEYAQLNKLNSEYYAVAKEKHDYLNEIGGYGV